MKHVLQLLNNRFTILLVEEYNNNNDLEDISKILALLIPSPSVHCPR